MLHEGDCAQRGGLKGKHIERRFNYLQAGKRVLVFFFSNSTWVGCSLCFASDGALCDINESPLLWVRKPLPLFLVIPNGRSDSIFSQHCRLNQQTARVVREFGWNNALEQWSFTGGKQSSWAISVFFIFPASSNDKPLTRSVMYELEAIALPQPKVLNLTSEIIPSSSTLICNFMTSPHLDEQRW